MEELFEIEPDVRKRIQSWIDGPFDEATKSEIRHLLIHNPQALSDAFFKDLTFGTGGMRGLMGIGTNRMNIYTIRTATQGLANYLQQQPKAPYSVFIGYDVREGSKLFAEEAGRVLAGNGIQVYLSREICPTPLVSFACRHFGCSAAIMITASHNPPQYNGYKIYWNDGAQVVPPHDTGIMEEVRQVQHILLDSIESPHILWTGREIDASYLKELSALRPHLTQTRSSLKLIYTNLHGTGIRIIPEALKQWGFYPVSLVDSQTAPDGQFRNAPSPNPEEPAALEIGTKQLLEEQADLLLATDPDADRVGVVVRYRHTAIRLTGNQIACLCLHHICTSLSDAGQFPENGAFIKTIVTTELFKKIAESFGGASVDVLTGFKYIGEKIRLWENSFAGFQFLFGAEESYGYLFGTFVRDKDAISACCLIAEAASMAQSQGLTLVDKLYALYQIYGIHRETLATLAFSDSAAGMQEMQTLMRRLREHPPSNIGGQTIVSREDYSTGEMPLPKSDVLRFWLSDSSKLVIRPSGTEPKIKIYAEVIQTPTGSMEEDIAAADSHLNALVNDFRGFVHRT
ncbi:MAG: phospho-sugar mutase [Chlamydiia bacterium]|nr:phospho-sugar mutase [Chlamydiia bacterium]